MCKWGGSLVRAHLVSFSKSKHTTFFSTGYFQKSSSQGTKDAGDLRIQRFFFRPKPSSTGDTGAKLFFFRVWNMDGFCRNSTFFQLKGKQEQPTKQPNNQQQQQTNHNNNHNQPNTNNYGL